MGDCQNGKLNGPAPHISQNPKPWDTPGMFALNPLFVGITGGGGHPEQRHGLQDRAFSDCPLWSGCWSRLATRSSVGRRWWWQLFFYGLAREHLVALRRHVDE